MNNNGNIKSEINEDGVNRQIDLCVSKHLTHGELVKIAKRWLEKAKGCGVAVPELVSITTEIPDAIGFRSDYSILVECKISRADYLADMKKEFRAFPELGMGDYRFYMCPTGLIKPEELPKKWGLVYVNENGKARQIVGGNGNMHHKWEEWRFEKNSNAEYRLMYSLLRRVHLNKNLEQVFSGAC